MLTAFDFAILAILTWYFFSQPNAEYLADYYMSFILSMAIWMCLLHCIIRTWFDFARRFL